MQTITLNDGSAYQVHMCGISGPSMVLVMDAEMSVLEAAQLFADENKTAEIECGGAVYEGYTVLYGVTMTGIDRPQLLITLIKG